MGFKVGRSIVIQDVTMLDNLRSGGLKAKLTNLKQYEIVESHETYFYIQDDNGDLFMVADYEFKHVELVNKNKKRIEHLENVVSQLVDDVQELHLIVHGLRGKKDINITTDLPKEEIVEFEGNQYCKVDREAREGDVVVLKGSMQSQYILNGVPYKTFIGRYDCLAIQANGSDHIKLYSNTFKRTFETVNVYELIEQPKGEVKQGINNEQAERLAKLLWSEPKTVNQQRAEIIEKAKEFIEINLATRNLKEELFFNVLDKERKVALVICDKPYIAIHSYCKEGKVFNEHIQKAIALGTLLGFDVSEFENAVQPDDFVEGQVVLNVGILGGEFRIIRTEFNSVITHENKRLVKTHAKIINDTNAKYQKE